MAQEKRFLQAGVVLAAVSVLLQLSARNADGFAQWYAVTIYPVLTATIGRFFGLFPFSAVEAGLYGMILLCTVWGILNIRRPFRILARTWFLLTMLFFVYTVNCGINYHRLPFSAYLDFKVQPSSLEELKELCGYLTKKVNEEMPEAISMGEEGAGQSRFPSAEVMNEEGVKAMRNLGGIYPALRGYYPRPKGVAVSEILSWQQLSGIYSPFTIEANYNSDMTAYNIPYTICHELSHLRGFMREDEANFIGFLACIHSDSQAYRYSGYLMAWIYAGNALAKVDMEAYLGQVNALNSQIKADLTANNMFWERYEGKVAEAANKVNDSYLKANKQEDGVDSYGRMVDLMLAYYRDMK